VIADEARYLADWFDELSAARQYGMDGPNPIAFVEMLAWQSITGNIVLAEEWAVLRDMDFAFLNTVAIEREADRKARESKAKEGKK
jgi:hypothetical protein